LTTSIRPRARLPDRYRVHAFKDYGFLRNYAAPGAGDLEPGQAFSHRKDGPPDFDYDLLPSRDDVFEFTLAEDRGDIGAKAIPSDLRSMTIPVRTQGPAIGGTSPRAPRLPSDVSGGRPRVSPMRVP
jgi:hypothetical protein